MNISHQFPPSSPLLNNDSEQEDGFSAVIQQKHNLKTSFQDAISKSQNARNKEDAYLTPDPSSSLGDVTVGSEIGDHSMIEAYVKASPSKTGARIEKEVGTPVYEPQTKKVKLNDSKSIDVTKPLSVSNFRNVINVPLNGDTFKIGRSGLSCSFKLDSSNKLISRVHAQINYEKDTDMIVLKCTGFNGINITVPKPIAVKHLQDNEYLVLINDSAETDDEDSEDSRILNKNSSFTNFFMLKNESIKMPLIEGVVLDFRGELALLVFNQGKLSFDQETQTVLSIPTNSRKLSTAELTAIVTQKKLQFSTRPTLSEIEKKSKSITNTASPIAKKQLSNTIIYKKPTPTASPTASPVLLTRNGVEKSNTLQRMVTPTPEPNSAERKVLKDITEKVTNTSSLQSSLSAFKATKLNTADTIMPAASEKINAVDAVKPTAIVKAQPVKVTEKVVEKPKITEIKRLVIEKPKDRVVVTPPPVMTEVQNVTPKPLDIAIETTVKPCESIKPRERSKTPENDATDEHKRKGRPKKVKKTEEETLKTMPQEEIDQILSTVPELEDISNLITNHIAYSRVLQTPFSLLLELNSIKKHSLSKLQLRSILIHHIDCIGVIFRQGKDAAGKQLDEEYYYVPEKDSDKQRVMLVEELKGSSSHLRSCRKTHKQYFWKKPKV